MDEFLGPVKRAILKTVLYYDIFDYPLTSGQIFLFISSPDISKEEVEANLGSAALARYVDHLNGYYFVRGKRHIVTGRLEKEKHASYLWSQAVRAARYIRHLPFIRGIYISGDLSKGIADHNSDLDFFIITSKRRVWICKLFLALFRRIPFFNPGKLLCFNYLLSDESLELKEKNIFTAAEIASLAPIYNLQLFEEFLKMNDWVSDFMPRYRSVSNGRPCMWNGRLWLRSLFEFPFRNPIATSLDHLLMHIWRFFWSYKYKDDPETRELLLAGTNIDYSKSHGYPRSTVILAEFDEKLKIVGLSN